MVRDVFATGPATTLAAALAAMEQLGIGCLPVVDDPLLIGLLTRTDLERAGARVVR
jgi:CBS domain-containing protein